MRAPLDPRTPRAAALDLAASDTGSGPHHVSTSPSVFGPGLAR